MSKKTIVPPSIKADLDALIEFVEHFDNDGLQKHIKSLRQNFVDVGSLMRVSSFASSYGKRYHGNKVSTQAIYQKIDKGQVTEYVIDGVKFIDRTMLERGE